MPLRRSLQILLLLNLTPIDFMPSFTPIKRLLLGNLYVLLESKDISLHSLASLSSKNSAKPSACNLELTYLLPYALPDTKKFPSSSSTKTFRLLCAKYPNNCPGKKNFNSSKICFILQKNPNSLNKTSEPSPPKNSSETFLHISNDTIHIFIEYWFMKETNT